MTIQLIDVLNSPAIENAGTCELCFHTMEVDNPVFVLKDSDTGETKEVDGYFWSYGDYFSIYIENVPDFANWLASQKDLALSDVDTYEGLDSVVDQYYDDRYDEEN